jgi:hypothetical protein
MIARKYAAQLRSISLADMDLMDSELVKLIPGGVARVNIYAASMSVDTVEESPKYDVRHMMNKKCISSW